MKLKILLGHSYYQIRGGEDAVFEQEVKKLGEDSSIDCFQVKNRSGITGLLQFLFSGWNAFVVGRFQKKFERFKPSLIHIHNWHFGMGPAVIRAAKRNKIPVVITLHNYRLICPSASLMNGDKPFTKSLQENFPWTAIRKKVYRNSYCLTFWLALTVWFHKKIGTWQMVDRYIVLTPFAKNLFLQSTLGITEQQIVVKPNFVEEPGITIKPRKGFLFAGRFTEEKGIPVLLKAFSQLEHPLVLAGEGPMQMDVQSVANQSPHIQYLGRLNKQEMLDAMASCEALIFPSVWYEGMPMTIIEAFASGTPVIASRLGAMESMIKDGYNGLHFEPGNTADLIKKIETWQSFSEEQKSVFRKNALATYQEIYTPEKNKEQLLNIYRKVLSSQ